MKEIIKNTPLTEVYQTMNQIAISLTDPHAPKFFKSNEDIAIDELRNEGELKLIAGDNPLVDEYDSRSHLLIDERAKEIARRKND